MKVIEFPGKGKAMSVPAATGNEHQKLHLGPVGFTCPHCNTTSEIHCTGMIFRTVEFHCSQCGNLFKIVNPAFSSQPLPPKKTLSEQLPPPKSK